LERLLLNFNAPIVRSATEPREFNQSLITALGSKRIVEIKPSLHEVAPPAPRMMKKGFKGVDRSDRSPGVSARPVFAATERD
jgi:hypothetical protein